MNRAVLVLAMTLVAATFAAPAQAAAPATKTEPAPAPAPADALAVSVARAAPEAALCPGEPVPLAITLENRTARPLMIPNWEFFAEMIEVRVRITGYPGASAADDAAAPEPPAAWKGRPFQHGDFRPLPPGKTVVARSVTPMLPGRAAVTVAVCGPSAEYRSLTDGRARIIDRGWTGRVEAGLAFDVPDAESAAMKDRYALCRERLVDPLVPTEQRGRLLAAVAAERHYLAARFLREQCDALPPGPMRDAAIGDLLALAKVGTGYEAIPLLLKAMGDASVAQRQRELLLAWAEESLARGGRQTIAEQAWYTWPEALRKDTLDQIERLTKDRNPYLAARAKEALRRLAKAAGP